MHSAMAHGSMCIYVFVLCAVIGFVSGSCPTGWIEHGSSCYFFSQTQGSWNKAQDDCIKKGAYLAELETKEESDYIMTYAKQANKNFWTGGRDDIEGHWVWVTSGRDFTYTNWWPGQPDNSNGGEDCLMTAHYWNDQWNDNTCTYPHFYVCEKKLGDNKGIFDLYQKFDGAKIKPVTNNTNENSTKKQMSDSDSLETLVYFSLPSTGPEVPMIG